MKLVIQIPCHNEAETLPQTIADLPTALEGVDTIEYLVIDDGSTDGTPEIAHKCGVHHIVRHAKNRGLARSFETGLEASLRAGADIIVNTDGDNQYCGEDVELLIQPILREEADMVIGDRQTWKIQHFSLFKRLLQKLGSSVVRTLSATDVPDAVSGFRAISRAAAMRLNVISSFSYTIETLIQSGQAKLAISSVPVRTNRTLRPSRLFKSIPQFLRQSGVTMVRAYALHCPLKVFIILGTMLFGLGFIPIVRFLYFVLIGDSSGHIQSLILGAALTMIGCSTAILGLLADLIAANRKLLETTLEKVRHLECQLSQQTVDSIQTRETFSEVETASPLEAAEAKELLPVPASPIPLAALQPTTAPVMHLQTK